MESIQIIFIHEQSTTFQSVGDTFMDIRVPENPCTRERLAITILTALRESIVSEAAKGVDLRENGFKHCLCKWNERRIEWRRVAAGSQCALMYAAFLVSAAI